MMGRSSLKPPTACQSTARQNSVWSPKRHLMPLQQRSKFRHPQIAPILALAAPAAATAVLSVTPRVPACPAESSERYWMPPHATRKACRRCLVCPVIAAPTLMPQLAVGCALLCHLHGPTAGSNWPNASSLAELLSKCFRQAGLDQATSAAANSGMQEQAPPRVRQNPPQQLLDEAHMSHCAVFQGACRWWRVNNKQRLRKCT